MRRSLAAPLLALALAVGAPTAASATACTSSTPSSTTFLDAAGDVDSYAGTYFAPDITGLVASLDSACTLTLNYTTANPPKTNDFYAFYIDADNNPATGYSSGFTGADFAIGREPNKPPALMQIVGGQPQHVKWLTGVGTYGASLNVSDIGATSGVPLRLAGGTSWTSSSTGNRYTDFAPDVSQPPFSFPITFSTAAPAPPATPAPTPTVPSTPPAPTPSTPTPGSDTATTTPVPCTVPRLKGLRIAQARRKLEQAHCRMGRKTLQKAKSRYVGKVLGTTPPAGATLRNGATVAVRVGARVPTRMHAHRAAAAQMHAAAAMLDGDR